LGDLRFRVSSHSFFQTNTAAAEGLYDEVLRCADLTGSETVWDLYCGTGSIALYVARRARSVLGFEVVEEAVRDAHVNCDINGIDNCRFVSGDLKDVIGAAMEGKSGAELPGVVITDPPRAGMHPRVAQAIQDLAPEKIVTVSCNPSTLARDLGYFLDHYRIEKVQPFDLFPHTPHIECVAKLVRKT
jgi:23S rRNA (uracil1939-C5)-methyltransferase